MGLKQRLLIFIGLFTVIGASGLLLANYFKAKQAENVKTEVEGAQDISTVPRITNLPPIEAFAGKEYRYDVQVVDSDTFTGDLLLTIEQGPTWLFKSGLSIYGTPDKEDIGTHDVIFTVSDGKDTVTKEYYIVVSSDEGSN